MKSILPVKKVLGLVEMTSVLVNARFSLPEWHAVKMIFFAPCKYRKIPKISPRAYIFQRPFLRGLFLEVLIFGGAYLGREIWASKSNGLALYLELNLPFLFCFTLYLRAIFQVQAPECHEFGGLIFEGAYFRNFMVSLQGPVVRKLISAIPGLNFILGFFFFCSKHFPG